MAERKPFVNIGGMLQELPSGDTLPGAGGSIAPGTIAYFATDPGAGWLKCDGSIYLRSSYADLSAALPLTLDYCPPVFVGDVYTNSTGPVDNLTPIPGTNLFAAQGKGGKELVLVEYDPSTQTISHSQSSAAGLPDNTYGISAANTADGIYICGISYGAYIYKLTSGGTLSKLSFTSGIPTGWCGASAFFGGGQYLAISFDTADVNGIKGYVYERSGDTFTKVADIPGSKSGESLQFSPSGRTVVMTGSTGGGSELTWDVSGTTFTQLTTPNQAPNTVYAAAFHPTLDTDVWVSGWGDNRTRVRTGSGVVIQPIVNDYVLNLQGGGFISFANLGSDMAVITADNSPYLAVLRISRDGAKRVLFTNNVSSGSNHNIPRAVFTPDNRAIIHSGSASNKLAIIKSDTTKFKLPWQMQNGLQGWIKT